MTSQWGVKCQNILLILESMSFLWNNLWSVCHYIMGPFSGWFEHVYQESVITNSHFSRGHFGVYFMSYKAAREINTKITHKWAHKHFIKTKNALFYFLHNMMSPWWPTRWLLHFNIMLPLVCLCSDNDVKIDFAMLVIMSQLWRSHIKGNLPKGPYLPCVSMAGRALLARYPRHDCDSQLIRYRFYWQWYSRPVI